MGLMSINKSPMDILRETRDPESIRLLSTQALLAKYQDLHEGLSWSDESNMMDSVSSMRSFIYELDTVAIEMARRLKAMPHPEEA